jgi:hypothetical protein
LINIVQLSVQVSKIAVKFPTPGQAVRDIVLDALKKDKDKLRKQNPL